MKVKTFNFEDKALENKALEAHKRLYFYLNRAKLTLERLALLVKSPDNIPNTDLKEVERYKKWFGDFNASNVKEVTRIITEIHKKFEEEKICLYYATKEPGAEPNDFAYVEQDDIDQQILNIYLCNMFFRTKENTERFNTALGTILHELTHSIGKTDDVEIIDCNKKQTTCYGEELCTYLASFNSKLAIKNADNYEMYLETFRNM